MHRFSLFCPMSVDGNTTRDSFLWTEKAAIHPDITCLWCGATSVWSLKCWITSDSPSPSFQVNLCCLVMCNFSPAGSPAAGRSGGTNELPRNTKSLQSPGGNAWWDVLLQGNPVLQWHHNPLTALAPLIISSPLHYLESTCFFFFF